MKKEMIKQGLLDKHGKPNEKTPPNYLTQLSQGIADMGVTTPQIKQEFVIPSEGNEPPPSKRKVSYLLDSVSGSVSQDFRTYSHDHLILIDAN